MKGIDFSWIAAAQKSGFPTASLLHVLNGIDRVTPPVLQVAELASAARLAQSIAGSTALDALRSAKVLDAASVAALSSISRERATLYTDMASIVASVKVAEDLCKWVTSMDAGARVLRGISTPSIQALTSYVRIVERHPLSHSIQLSGFAGAGVTALLGTELLTGTLGQSEREARTRVQLQVIRPWTAAPQARRERLRSRLHALSPELPAFLDDAWNQAQKSGAVAISAFGNSCDELLNRALRAAAPDSEVEAWYIERQLEVERDSRGHPTHGARLRFLLRNRKGDRRLLQAQLSSLTIMRSELSSKFNAAKHASVGNSDEMETHLISIEAYLLQVFLPD